MSGHVRYLNTVIDESQKGMGPGRRWEMELLHSSQELPEAANSSSSLASTCSKGNSNCLESPLELCQFAVIPDAWAITCRKKWSKVKYPKYMRQDEPGKYPNVHWVVVRRQSNPAERMTIGMKSPLKCQS